MPYTKTNWVSGTTPASATNMNNLESQFQSAMASFNQDLLTPSVLSGLAAVKDATTATKLNVVAGVAYLRQSDNTLNRVAPVATNFTTSVISTTYYLDLNPDGTWSWSTSHSAQANYLSIAQVTTDASANISGVTDARVMHSQVLIGGAHPAPNQPGGIVLPSPLAQNLTQNPLLGAGFHGSVTLGQAGAIRGSMDTAALFDGATGYLSAPTTGLPTSANAPLSLECWYKQSAAPANTQSPVALGNPGVNGAEFYIAFATSTAPWAGNGTVNSNSAGATTTNVWHHAVATFDGANIRLYVDGALVSGPTAASITLAYGGLFIGQLGNSSDWFAGSIDEVAVYTTALSSAQVTNHYNAGISTTSDAYATTVLADSPARYYRLGDLTSTFARAIITPTLTLVIGADGALNTPVQAAIGVAQWQPVDSGGVVYDNITAPDGAARSRMLRANSGANVSISCLSLNTDGSITAQGAIRGVGGQASVGSFGVPVIVAQAIGTLVTSTAQQTILSFTAPADGMYRASLWAFMGNANTAAIRAEVLYTEPISGGNPSPRFVSLGPGTTVTVVDGVNTWSHNVSITTMPLTIFAKSGTAIQIVYQDSTATPNDTVSAMIERLS